VTMVRARDGGRRDGEVEDERWRGITTAKATRKMRTDTESRDQKDGRGSAGSRGRRTVEKAHRNERGKRGRSCLAP